eukprot:6327853-Karenia_brevis.AAC.1
MPVLNVDTLHQGTATKQQDNIEEQQVWAGIIAIRPKPIRTSPMMDPIHLSSSANTSTLEE